MARGEARPCGKRGAGPVKILHTVHHYHPHIGGCEEVVKSISERLVGRGHEVTVATSVEPGRDFTELNGVTVEQFDLSGNTARYRGIRGDGRAYVDFVLGGEWDVVLNYASQTWCSDLLFPHLPEIEAVKVYVPVGYSHLYKRKYGEYYRNLPGYLRQYDHLIYMSPDCREREFGDIHGISHYSVIPNAASEEEFSREPLGFRERYGVGDSFLLLCVANFDPVKRHGFVREAFLELKDDAYTLVFIGNSLAGGRRKLLNPYYARTRILGLLPPRIKILENLGRPWVVSAIQEADILLLGSLFEGGCPPLVIAEAMASGTPFVSANCGGVEDYSGYGVIVEHPGEMAAAVKELRLDEERRTAMGEAARVFWRENLTWDIVAGRYEELYERLLQRRRSGQSPT